MCESFVLPIHYYVNVRKLLNTCMFVHTRQVWTYLDDYLSNGINK